MTKTQTTKRAATKATKKTAKKKIAKKKVVKMSAKDNSLDFAEKDDSLVDNRFPRGKSGTLVTSGIVDEDHIDSLKGTTGQDMWEKMLRSDTQVRKIHHGIVNPIKSAEWDIEPASEDTRDVEIAALIRRILFDDIPGGWEQKLDEILTFPMKGHCVMEVVNKNFVNVPGFGSYTGLADLGFRDQRTLTEWEFDPKLGVLKQIHQEQSGDLEVDAWMPAETLLIFYNEKKGNDTGYPFARMLYGPYKRKLLAKQLQLIGTERSGIGTPALYVPENVVRGSEQFADAETQLAAYTNAETSYFIIPDGWKLELNNNNTFDPAKIQVVIKSENEEMVGSVIAMFLEMGLGGNSGNKAGTETAMKFFANGLKYLANKIKRPINSQLIPALVRMNFGDTVDVFPKLVYSGLTEEAGLDFMTAITGFVGSQVITRDEPLEDFIRKIYKLPKKAEGEMLDNQEAEDGDDTTPPEGTNEEEPEDEKVNDGTELKLAAKGVKLPPAIINDYGAKVSEVLRRNLTRTSEKLVNDIMVKYKDLPAAKKGNAINSVKPGYVNALKKELKITMIDNYNAALSAVKDETGISDVKLSAKPEMLKRMELIYGDISDIKLNEFSKLPPHIQVLIGKQSELIAESSIAELSSKVAFKFESRSVRTDSPAIIQQGLEDTAKDYVEGSTINTKGINNAALITNETRNTFFFDDDVIDEVHSFTFVNIAPKSPICRELAGSTFATNDVQSMFYTPPLHHNCKSYLRANLNTSRGVERLEITSLSPTDSAKKSITL